MQVVSYLANAHKHAGVDRSQVWAVEIGPRLGKPFLIGQQHSFPHALKPTVLVRGDSLPGLEFTGSARVDGQVHEFGAFEWRFDCQVEDKDGKPIGNVWGICAAAFQTWLKVLADNGISV